MIGRVTPEEITSLPKDTILVFASNKAGRHGAGTAKLAMNFGAQYGNPVGLQGRTYAIPTKNIHLRVLPLDEIARYVNYFISFARENPSHTFWVVKIGCGLANYRPEQIAPLFQKAVEVENIHLPSEFWTVLGRK